MFKNFKKRFKNKVFTKYFTEYSFRHEKNFSDISDEESAIIKKVEPFTMTNPERIVSLLRAVDYVESNDIKGSFVECGVWKGGSVMASILKLKNLKNLDRDIYLYDTFEGMTEPTEVDKSFKNESANDIFVEKQDDLWCYSSLGEVKDNLSTLKYPDNKLHFVEGKVEDTIPGTIPRDIAILRLDTDWYESTIHELNHLYPRLVKGGVIIIDDYGHWQGCRKAVDEYVEQHNIRLLLNRVDYTCRIGVKH